MFEDFRLKVFMQVASQGSFTKAAKALGISQPAVSQNIAELEKIIGAPLFERTRGEISLTPQGLTFKEYAAKILYWYSAADSMFGASGKLTASRPIRIAASDEIASYILPRALSTLFGAGLTSINFVIQSYPVEGADLTITSSPRKESIDFEGESSLIGVLQGAAIASVLNKEASSYGALPPDGNLAIWSKYEALLPSDILSRVVMTSDSIETVKSVVAVSPSMTGLVPMAAAKSEGSLMILPLPLPSLQLDIHFVSSKTFSTTALCSLLRETLSSVQQIV